MMTNRHAFTRIALVTLLSIPVAQADWKDMLKPLEKAIGTKIQSSSSSMSALSTEDTVAGLKEALSVGISNAIKLLGKDGGFLNDSQVKIPLPKTLQKIEKGLRLVGQEKLADDFIGTINGAAEKAVPETAHIFSESIKNMSIDDAKGILNGPDDAATQYLRKAGGTKLEQAILPIVKNSTTKTGVTASYKKMVGKAGALSRFTDTDSLDIDKYVTGKTLDGLFAKLAEEEKKIRQNPLARSTELLKKVFSNTSK